ncbi:MAG: type II toxin-antitoxin system VapC family toxin [Chloroflexi bacterium]|nr:type II toxin-antitoxin system VapC family toxin [Chloroflexota bacterium]
MRYLLDTNILSELMLPDPSSALLLRLAMTAPEDRATSSIAVGELMYGAHRVSRSAHMLTAIRRVAMTDIWVLPFDQEAAEEYGQLRSHLEARGRPIGEADTQIAAIALANDLTVVTANVRHFERVPGLVVENWLE